jgi:hypothetical protein
MAARSVNPQTRAGDSFAVAGARIIASVFSDEECCECGIPLDSMGGEGLQDGDVWRCDSCAALPRSYRRES